MQKQNEVTAAPRSLLPVAKFSEKYVAWSEPALRNLILNADNRKNSRGEVVNGNGLAPAVVRVGRRVLIDEQAFFQWIAEQQRKA